jgi:branched-chain amino acid transport system permease protein
MVAISVLWGGIVNGSLMALLSVAFGLIVGVTGRFHYAIATTYLYAAMITAVLVRAGVPFAAAVVSGLAVGMILGVAMEILVYRPIASGVTMGPVFFSIVLSSWGIIIIGENVAMMLWGSTGLNVLPGYHPVLIHIGAFLTMSSFHIIIVAVALLCVSAITVFLRYTSLGRSIQAVRVNPDMSQVVGIDPQRVYVVVFAIGSLVAALTGILQGIKTAAIPGMAALPTLYAFVIVFVAGTQSSPLRFALTGLLVGIIGNASTLWVQPYWQPVIVFTILFAYVALRPDLRRERLNALRRSIGAPFTKARSSGG